MSATIAIIAITCIVSLIALLWTRAGRLYDLLQLDKPAVATGEYWRLWTVTLAPRRPAPSLLQHVRAVPRRPDRRALVWVDPLLVFYLACAAAGSTASFVFGGDVPSVGASGAIFGLFGILLAAGRVHHPVDPAEPRDRQQLGVLIVINIVFGFASGGTIDNAAHLGGLAAGLWLGALVPPTGVPTLSSLWQRPGDTQRDRRRSTAPGYVAVLGLAVVGIVVAAGIAVGTTRDPDRLA